MKVDIFIAYAPVDKDEAYLLEIEKSILFLKKSNTKYKELNLNHRGFISAGAVIQEEVKDYLNSSDLILPLFSMDFLANATEPAFKSEFNNVIKKHKDGKATVIPIVLRVCPWQDSYFKILSPLPKKGIPIQKWEIDDEAYTDIYNGIKKVVDEIIENKKDNINEETESEGGKIFRINKNKPRGTDFTRFMDAISNPLNWDFVRYKTGSYY